jgi:purine-cytosine permease-like protein
MKINGVKLNKKNFWIPFLISSVTSFLIFLFTLAMLISGDIKKIGIVILMSLPSSIFPLTIISISSFFIIRRLLNKNPKKVFYLELPILIIIYSIIVFINQIIGLMIGGPMGMTTAQILGLILPQIIFVIIWLAILTISLYFYYKKSKLLKR